MQTNMKEIEDRHSAIITPMCAYHKTETLKEKYKFSQTTIRDWKTKDEDDGDFWRRIAYEYFLRYNEEAEVSKYEIFTEEELKCDPEINRSLFELNAGDFDSFSKSPKKFKKVLYNIITKESTFILRLRISFLKSCIKYKSR